MDKRTIAQSDLKALINQARGDDSVRAIIMVELPVDTILAMDALIHGVDGVTRDNFIGACIEFWLSSV